MKNPCISSVTNSDVVDQQQALPASLVESPSEPLQQSQATQSEHEENLQTITSLEQLRAHIPSCVKCSIAQERTNTVFGVGNPNADLMVVGEAPGKDEDLQGEPFVGRAGQLLDKMLAAIGLRRDQAFIANILKCRPTNNRDPQKDEIANCIGYLNKQIELIQPKVILSVGRVSAQSLLGSETPISRLRGKPHDYGEAKIPLIATYHPAYLLRSPAEKAKAWDDMKFVRFLLNQSE
ncbi:MAG: uracil-DNA glycosylase [Gammaproteobacteria bacterium]|nr:MAG: uracil-DNA glycosylase [Gammaproteobacteria bacterium]